MRKPKFKVGDKVKVLRASTFEEHHLWGDTWYPPGMDRYIGGKYIINGITREDNEFPSYRFKSYNFPEFVLQSEIQVGQQLLFSFMEEG